MAHLLRGGPRQRRAGGSAGGLLATSPASSSGLDRSLGALADGGLQAADPRRRGVVADARGALAAAAVAVALGGGRGLGRWPNRVLARVPVAGRLQAPRVVDGDLGPGRSRPDVHSGTRRTQRATTRHLARTLSPRPHSTIATGRAPRLRVRAANLAGWRGAGASVGSRVDSSISLRGPRDHHGHRRGLA